MPDEPDWNLRVRILGTLVLILVFPFGFAFALHWVFVDVAPVVFAVVAGAPVAEPDVSPTLRGTFTLVALAVVAGLAIQYVAGDRFALASIGAREPTDAEFERVGPHLERLATTADLPTPGLAVVDSDAPNALAVGRSQRSATVAVTTGLLEALDDDELRAVLAHELAHVDHRDGQVMTVAYLLPSLTVVVASWTYFVLVNGGRAILEGLSNSSGRNRDGRAVLAVIVTFVVTAVLTILISAAFWVGSFLLFRLLSRYREFAADRTAAELTGDPTALASALETIDGALAAAPDRDLRELDGGTEALCIAPLELADFDDDDVLVSRDLFPSTHPPTAERIDRLVAMAD